MNRFITPSGILALSLSLALAAPAFPAAEAASIVTRISSGSAGHTLIVREDGNLYGAGSNGDYQLALGDQSSRTLYRPAALLGPWRHVAATQNGVLAIKADSTLWAWGQGSNYVFGNNSTATLTTQQQIGTDRWLYVCSGKITNFSLGIKSDSTLWAWGENWNGQLGDGGTTQRSVPVQVGSAKWRMVSGAYTHSLGIRNDGTLWGWGDNGDGAIGNGNTTSSSVPVQAGSATWLQVAAGDRFSVGIRSDSTLWGWGDGWCGGTGLGNSNHSYSPAQVGTAKWIKIVSPVHQVVVAMRSDSTLWSWGSFGGANQLGLGSPLSDSRVLSPTQIGASKWRDVGGGRDVFVALDADGHYWSWGNGQALGTGSYGSSNVPVRISVPGQVSQTITFNAFPDKAVGDADFSPGATASSGLPIAYSSSDTTVAKIVGGSLRLVGEGTCDITASQAGDEAYSAATPATRTLIVDAAPIALPAGGVPANPTRISSGSGITFIIREDGNLYGTGNNYSRQLPSGGTQGSDIYRPAAVLGGWKHVAAAQNGGMAVKSDGSLWAWGQGSDYVFGNNSTATLDTMTRIGSDRWLYVTTGKINQQTLGIKEDSTLWAWGQNWDGQLGDGTTSQRTAPVQVGTAKWAQVSSAYTHTLAIRSDGTLWGWGNNGDGQLGNGTNTSSNVPVQSGNQHWLQVAAADRYSLGLRADSTLWAWGDGWCGGTGLGNTNRYSKPQRVGSGKWIKLVTPLHQVSIALRADSTLWSWGSFGGANQLGLGSLSNARVLSPTRIGTAKWRDVGGGRDAFAALDASGQYWAWGGSSLGAGSTSSSNVPVMISVPGRAAQILSFWDNLSLEFSATPVKLSGTASSGLPVAYAVSDTTVARISNDTLFLLKAGICDVTASQSGDAVYSPATPVTRSLNARTASQTLTFGALPEKTLGDADFSPGATASSGLPIAYSSSDTTVAKIVGGNVRLIAAGTADITASQSGSGGYAAASPVARTLVVNEAPVPMPAGGRPAYLTRFSSGSSGHALLIREDGNLYGTGSNGSRQLPLGHSNSVDTYRPATLPGPWKHVAATQGGGLAIKGDGSLWAWGQGGGYVFGNNSTASLDSMTRIGTDSWLMLTTGKINNHTLGIKADSTLWAWGENGDGSLGDGTTTLRQTPLRIGSGKWLDVSNSYTHTLAIKSDGTLWGWGDNGDGQLGNGTNTSSNVPVQSGNQHWLQVSAGDRFSLGLRADSTLWAWGDGWCGGTGLGNASRYSLPQRVGTAKWIRIVSPVHQVVAALRADSTLWSWGSIGGAKQLGLGSPLSDAKVQAPTQIGTSKWRDVGGGCESFAALDATGQYWAWGNGQAVGNGSGTGSNVPVRISVPGTPSTPEATTPASQTIAFAAFPAKTFGDSAFTLSATASSGLGLAFTSSNPGIARITGSTLTIMGAGTAEITATQAGNASYASATLSRTLVVNKAAQAPLAFSLGSDSVKTVGDPDFRISAGPVSGLVAVFTSSDSGVARISGDTVRILKAGVAILTASQEGDSNHLAAVPISATLRVRPAPPAAIDVARIPSLPDGSVGTTVEIVLPRIENATGYQVQAAIDASKPAFLDTLLSSPTLRLTDLTPGQSYVWRAAPVNGSSQAPFTPWLTFKVRERDDGTISRGAVVDSASKDEVRIGGLIGITAKEGGLGAVNVTLSEGKTAPPNLASGFQPLTGRIELDAQTGSAEVKDNQIAVTLRLPDTALDGKPVPKEERPMVYLLDSATGRMEALYDLEYDVEGRIILPLSKGKGFMLAVDTLPPIVRDSTPPALRLPGSKPTIIGNVEDNIRNSRGWIKYRPGGAETFDSAAVAIDSNGHFELPLALQLDSTGFEYHLVATDGRNRRATARADLPVGIGAMRAADSLPVMQWRLFALPTLPEETRWAEVAASLGRYHRDWKLFERADDGLREFGPDLERAAPGTAYWLKTRSKRFRPSIPGGVAATVNKPFEVVLPPGSWRSFGNPYLFPVSWQSVLDSSHAPSGALVGPYTYRDTSWLSPLEVPVLEPWEGYYAHNASADTVILRIPSYKAKDAQSLLARAGFHLQWVARSADGKDAGNLLGTLPASRDAAAKVGATRSTPATGAEGANGEAAMWRAPKPESPDEVVHAGFADGAGGLLQTDFRPPASAGGDIWTARLSGLKPGQRYSNRLLGVDSLPEGLAAAIADPITGAFLPWTAGMNYVVETADGQDTRDLGIYVGTAEFVASHGAEFSAAFPASLSLGIYPNPVREFAMIGFSLPAAASMGTPDVNLKIYDSKGRTMRTLAAGKLSAGRHTVRWDARNEAGRRVAAGIYRMRLEVGGKSLVRAVHVVP